MLRFVQKNTLQGSLLVLCLSVLIISPHLDAKTLIEPDPALTSAPAASTKLAPSFSLSDTIRYRLSGFRFEPQEKQKELLRDAKLYVTARKHPQNKKNGNNTLVKQCDEDSEISPFCILLEEANERDHRKPKSIAKTTRDKTQSRRLRETAQWIKEGKIEKLSVAKEQDIRDALRTLDSLDDLKKTVEPILNNPACETPLLSQLLGAKTEEFLPEPDVREKAMQLYEKAANCGDTESSAKAKFRLSLLSIWKGDYKKASGHLKALSEQVNYTDYRSRALFWQFQCAAQLKDEKSSTQARQSLQEKYPFSLHTLLVGSKNLPIDYQLDSEILYRSKKDLDLNRRVMAAEALMEIHEEKWAKEALEKSTTNFDATEPEFRLYAGVIYHRLDQYLKKFKVLNSAFKDLPSLISKPALDLYYAQNTLQAHDLSQIDVDGTLLLSLIRQESAFNSQARSPAGALGLMQIMPTTARKFARIRKISELLNPKVNIRIGSKYFANLLKTYGGDAELALAAYNAGPHRVDQWVKRYPVKDRVLFLDLIPFKETREYVAAIARNYYWYVTLSALSLQEAIPEERVEIHAPRKNIAKVFSLFATSM